MMACCIIADPVGTPPVYGSPEAEFTANWTETHGNFYVPLGTLVSFIDLSTGFPTSWQWTINGAVFSLSRNPTYYFSSVGVYAITLIASNSYGSSVPVTHTINVI